MVDGGEFLEMQAGWASNLVVGFARLNGRAVGVVANQPAQLGGQARHRRGGQGRPVRPHLRRVQHPAADLRRHARVRARARRRSRAGLLRDAAKLLYAYCEATVPKLTVVTGKAYGEAYEVMCSKHIRADFNLAWPSAEIAASATGGAVAALGGCIRPITAAKRGLPGRRHRARRHPSAAGRRSRGLRLQARRPSAQEAREHPAVSADSESAGGQRDADL